MSFSNWSILFNTLLSNKSYYSCNILIGNLGVYQGILRVNLLNWLMHEFFTHFLRQNLLTLLITFNGLSDQGLT